MFMNSAWSLSVSYFSLHPGDYTSHSSHTRICSQNAPAFFFCHFTMIISNSNLGFINAIGSLLSSNSHSHFFHKIYLLTCITIFFSRCSIFLNLNYPHNLVNDTLNLTDFTKQDVLFRYSSQTMKWKGHSEIETTKNVHLFVHFPKACQW